MSKSVVVIPCYNEAKRLDVASVKELSQSEDCEVLLVNDGSTDDTEELLNQLSAAEAGVSFHSLTENSGKAEAVRQGLLLALESGATIVGYLDADMATPAREMLRMLERTKKGDWGLVLGSRVRLLGHHVERQALRHYLGRGFATLASLALELGVYDTQCGAKLMRDTPALRDALSSPFSSSWAFDVELIARLLSAPEPLTQDDLLEVPLLNWEDKPGSKLSPAAMVSAGLDLTRLLAKRRLGWG